jgi:hypothetical protein
LLAIAGIVLVVLLPVYLVIALVFSVVSTLLAGMIGFFRRKRKLSCRFCGDELSMVRRPFLLKTDHLSKPGAVVDDYFYVCRPVGLWRKKCLMKCHNQCRVCHTCRLYEGRYQEVSEPVDAAEVSALRQGGRLNWL